MGLRSGLLTCTQQQSEPHTVDMYATTTPTPHLDFGISAQVRSAQLLSDLMSLNKHRLSGLTVQWRPIYKLVSQLLANPPTRTIEGAVTSGTRAMQAMRAQLARIPKVVSPVFTRLL